MIAHRTLSALLACLAFAACGSQEQGSDAPPVSETVFGPTVGTMDRARSVEDTTMQHKQDLDRALEAAEGNH
ncbi:MAG TPA: hypothetical protein VIL28_08730 [Steroidobacteraceae bacterium]